MVAIVAQSQTCRACSSMTLTASSGRRKQDRAVIAVQVWYKCARPIRLSRAAVLPVIWHLAKLRSWTDPASCYWSCDARSPSMTGSCAQQEWWWRGAGKNRPLDQDELEFLDALQQQEASVEQAWASEQERELDAFQKARRSACWGLMGQGPVCCATYSARALLLAASEHH